jgi:glucose/arabinose dehydrogenase
MTGSVIHIIRVCCCGVLFGYSFVAQAVELDRTLIASGLSSPVFLTAPPGDTNRLFVVEQPGYIKIINLSDNSVVTTPFLDINILVDSSSNEQGLLGLAFHPDYATNGYFYVYYTHHDGGFVDETRISRFQATWGADYSTSTLALANTEKILLDFSQPQGNHNGGMLAFEPRDDGKAYLYIASGDGGGSGDNDSGHNATIGNGQDLNTYLGKILRIDVDEGGEGAGTGQSHYDIPPSNPDLGGLDEIWAYGVRNPFRMSFDSENADLYIADVGQADWEEVNHQLGDSLGGENYGWRLVEGPECFNPSSNCDPGGLTDPIYSYDHDNDGGIAIIGGYVYRGSAIPFIEGHYIFADISGIVKTFLSDGNGATLIQDWASELPTNNISSFGVDGEEELYYMIRGSQGGSTGEVYKIIPTDNDIIYVDFSATGVMKGNESNPFNSLDVAVRSVSTGGLVEIEGLSSQISSDETLVIDRPMTITAVNGAIEVGANSIDFIQNADGFTPRL